MMELVVLELFQKVRGEVGNVTEQVGNVTAQVGNVTAQVYCRQVEL